MKFSTLSIPEKKMLELLGYNKGKIVSVKFNQAYDRSVEFNIIPDLLFEDKILITSVTIPNL